MDNLIKRDHLHFLLLNIGHFLDHMFTLIFATVAALVLYHEWNISYSELLIYATPGFFAFGLFSLPAGWLADRWNRDGMMSVFFIGIGLAAIATGFSQTPLQIGTGLFIIGMFAAIYHPVGLTIVTTQWRNTGMRIAINGVWGNLGVASAALITGFLIDFSSWRMAFIIPGVFAVMMGLAYSALRWTSMRTGNKQKTALDINSKPESPLINRKLVIRVFIIVFVTTALGSMIFQATTFALPKIFEERLQGLAIQLANWIGTVSTSEQRDTATAIGWLAFAVFASASIVQLLVGYMLDRFGPRPVFITVAAFQLVFFSLMPGLTDWLALYAALGFMLGAFGQIPINDYMIGKIARGEHKARIYAIRFVVGFTVLAASLPLIALVYQNWGFDVLFQILAGIAGGILVTVTLLPKNLAPAATTA